MTLADWAEDRLDERSVGLVCLAVVGLAVVLVLAFKFGWQLGFP